MPDIATADIQRDLDQVLTRILEGRVKAFRPTDRLREDLGLDSLHSMELLSDVTERYGLDVELEEVEHVRTVGDLVAFLDRAVRRP